MRTRFAKVTGLVSGLLLLGGVGASGIVAYGDTVRPLDFPTRVDSELMFIPKGFDDNDTTEVVLDGYFPSTCYKQTEPTIVIDRDNKKVTVHATASIHSGPCLQVLVPFTAVANIGMLAKGDYTVESSGPSTQTMNVAESTNSGPDDFLYAPVDEVQVEVQKENQKIYALIEGRFTNTCMVWEKTEVIDTNDTIQILPIIKMLERDDCRQEEFPYKVVAAEIPWRKAGRYLAHVRGLNGKAKNTVFSVY